ncbi:MAG: SAM-dependent chlorinase/fluorinase [Deltaproteobacteria bacterium]|nr:SAM-dependent chlorinase/fluorinase [Deltaproteobacteria bacterium]
MKLTPANRAALITLSSDFGPGSHFVGVMHGVISVLAPVTRIIDLCHTIRPHDRRQAGRLMAANYRYFPAGSIHVVVVDPGVGSQRRIILLKTSGHYFLAPDNGIISLIATDTPKSLVWSVKRPDLYLTPLSRTFHGRDVFAPLAAHLALGESPETMGRRLEPGELAQLKPARPLLDYELKQISGTVIDVDHFGNIITNISRETVNNFFVDSAITIDIGGRQLRGLASYYDEVTPGSVVVLFNSGELLEIAVNRGRACDFLQIKADDRVIVSEMG